MAHVTSLSPSPATANQALTTTVDGVNRVPTAIFGWSLAESTGSATAKIRLRDGTSVSSPVIAVITLLSNESARDWFGDQTLEIINGGIYLQVVSGSIEGAIFWGST